MKEKEESNIMPMFIASIDGETVDYFIKTQNSRGDFEVWLCLEVYEGDFELAGSSGSMDIPGSEGQEKNFHWRQKFRLHWHRDGNSNHRPEGNTKEVAYTTFVVHNTRSLSLG